MIKLTIITPTYNETEMMISKFILEVNEVIDTLKRMGVDAKHYFLSDGSNLKDLNTLIRHESPKGLAITLLDGYEAVLDAYHNADVIVRIDAQEHDPHDIVKAIDYIRDGSLAVLLPIVHENVNQENKDTFIKESESLRRSLNPINEAEILRLYNSVFPLGFQMFTREVLEVALPILKRGVLIYKDKFGADPTWGLDLLTAMIIAAKYPNDFRFYFNPKESKIWQQNKSEDKAKEQARRAQMMIEVAKELGL